MIQALFGRDYEVVTDLPMGKGPEIAANPEYNGLTINSIAKHKVPRP